MICKSTVSINFGKFSHNYLRNKAHPKEKKKIIYIYIYIYIYIRGVNVNALKHAIKLKMLTCYFFFTQINRIIRFDPNFLLSSQRGRLSVICDEGTVNQCFHGSGTTSGLF